jgi:hypothetical protein
MMRDGVCWARPISVPHISASECGLLPTPTTVGDEMAPSMMKWPVHRALQDLVARQALPTPTTKVGWSQRTGPRGSGQRKPSLENLLPTPTATLYGSNRGGAAGRTGPERPSLEHLSGGPCLWLREWMMGWPIGWTASAPLETARFLQWRQWLGGY